MKKKKHFSERLPASQFIILFSLLYAFSLSLDPVIFDFFRRVQFNITWQYIYPALTTIPIFLLGIGQGLLLKFQFGWSARKWIIASTIGTILMYFAGIGQDILLGFLPDSLLISWILGRIPLLILASVQFVLLRQYVQRAWLWILGMGAMTILNYAFYSLVYRALGATLIFSGIGTISLLAILGTIQGLILGMLLTMLVRHTIKEERQEFEKQRDSDDLGKRLVDSHQEELEFAQATQQAVQEHTS